MYGRGNATCEGGIEGAVFAVSKRPGCKGVLVILDGESDPVCRLGPELVGRCSDLVGVSVVISLADVKFVESWLVASAETLELPQLTFEAGDPVRLIRQALHPRKVREANLAAASDRPNGSRACLYA